MQLKLVRTFTLDGKTLSQTITNTDGQQSIRREETVPGAKTGTLTARTDNDTGSATLTGGHGITNGQRVDVYWDGGSRYGMIVGTVATNVVPLDGGAGDNLPSTSTAVRVAVAVQSPFNVVGADVLGLCLACAKRCTFVIEDADSILYAARRDENSMYAYVEGDGGTNPLVGETATKIFMSHYDTAAQTMTATACTD